MTILAMMWAPTNCRAGKSPANAGAYDYAISTTTGHFDANYTNLALEGERAVSEFVLDLEGDFSDIWLHFEVHAPAVASAASWIDFYDSALVKQFRLRGSSGNAHVLEKTTNGTAFTNVDGTDTFTISTNTLTRVDVHLHPHASAGEASVYLNETLTAVNVSGALATQSNNIRYVVFGSEAQGRRHRYSQIVAATTSTVGWKVQTIKPESGTAEVAQWNGTYADVDDDAWTTLRTAGLSSNTNNFRHTFPMPAIYAGASGLIVQGVAVSIAGAFSAGASVSDVQAVTRIAGVNYDSSDLGFVVGEGEQVKTHIWEVNPATSVGWSQADVNGAQFGLKSVT